MSFLERVAPGGASPPARRRLTRDVGFWRRGRVGRPGVRPREILNVPYPPRRVASLPHPSLRYGLRSVRCGFARL